MDKENNDEKYLYFFINGQAYCIEMEYIKAINDNLEKTNLNTCTRIYGLVNVRGNVVPIFSLSEMLKDICIDELENEDGYIKEKFCGYIVLEIENASALPYIAFYSEHIEKVISFNPDYCKKDDSKIPKHLHKYIKSIYTVENLEIFLLDIKAICSKDALLKVEDKQYE